MRWRLSQFRKGKIVEVRSKEEILATLDEYGCLDGMPFMPEMLQFCGQQFRVSAVAHKTCDTARQTWKGRRLSYTVHLEDSRCDGSAHDGCQAECNLFWKDQWLKARPPNESHGQTLLETVTPRITGCSENVLQARTRSADNVAGESVRYYCQATEMYNATEPLAWWDPRQYIFDVTTGNHSLGRVVRVLFLASLRYILPRLPVGHNVYKRLHDYMHKRLSGRPAPSLNSGIAPGSRTPTGKLNLRSGLIVQIKTQREIEKTIGVDGKNRGLSFDPEEMAPYCGRYFKVRKLVSKIIDEPTGRMLTMKEPCVTLEGVVCRAEYASERLNCPRAIPSYWREIWLTRVAENTDHSNAKEPEDIPAAGRR